MYAKLYSAACIICIQSLLNTNAFSEGTKQFRPASADNGNLEIYDQGRPFALESNTNPLNRLYIHIAAITEKIYLGFQHVGTGTATFRILNPAGSVVYARTTVPSSGNGYINTYNEAVAGPKVAGTPAGGYTPLSYAPLTTGDFYIEFTTSLNSTYHFDLFDIAVLNASNVVQTGRLWSYAWDLSTRGNTNAYNGSFYVYTNEGYVSKVSMNGIEPFGFVVSCNNTGTGNSGVITQDRKSISGNSTRPQFKVFLNNPDITQYPSASTPTLNSPITVDGGTVYYQQVVNFNVDVNAPGTIQIVLDMNGVAGYQDGTSDVIIAVNVVAGQNNVQWDGKNGFGIYPDPNTSIDVTTGFSAGITHLPIYDPETNPGGYIITRVRPGTGNAPIRWDDSALGGSYNISGGSGNGHVWATNFGDLKTIDTWWNGFEVENISAFTLKVKLKPLPIELTAFNCIKTIHNEVLVTWSTASETNNDFFTLEKTTDGVIYTTVATVKGAGTCSTTKKYAFTDVKPFTGTSFYRLKQTDFNGTFVYTAIKSVNIIAEKIVQKVTVFPNPSNGDYLNIAFEDSKSSTASVTVNKLNGEEIYKDLVNITGINNTISFDNKIQPGEYVVTITNNEESTTKKIIVR